MPDDLGADDRALAQHHLEHVGGQSGLDQQVAGPQRGQAGLRVGLHHDGVARDERREGVTDGQFERVVPGRDLADDAARVAQLGDLRQHRHGARVPLGPQIGGGSAAVVAGGDGDRLDLLVRVQPGLAGLQLDQVQHLGLTAEHQVVEAQQHGGTLPDRCPRPHGLGGAGRVERLRHVLGRRLGQVGQLRAGERRVARGAAGTGDAPGELGDQFRRDHVGSGACALGAGARGLVPVVSRVCASVMRRRVCLAEHFVYPSVTDSPSAHTPPVNAGTEPLIRALTRRPRFRACGCPRSR